ncbi:C4-dicarboxylate ABC transporter substrate-binding protein [Undibacter mobilis]|uniref:C4-dicarboxylate ABC transporter substrate-binding protein n=1 Tax=Undibacter mobilis TaxID=2292256 RepID=A0A371BE87_9BRAD|nr:C4-dicarboxylate ABC transporter substrate-binding protein [Undibacter mobilis]
MRFVVSAATLLALPAVVAAQPVSLKLSFFSSDRTVAYTAAIKPFVDAVNRDGAGLVNIEVYTSGTLGKVQRELPDLVLSGAADMAFIVPGQNPDRFVDTGVIELPGLFQSVREATLTFTELAKGQALAGYSDFFVIGVFTTSPDAIHSRKPIRSIADLRGQRIRVNNAIQAEVLTKLGARPSVIAFNETAPAIMSGEIDGALTAVPQLFDVGIGRLTSYHFLLNTSVAPLTLLMNRKALDALSPAAQAIIRKYSGDWAAASFIDVYEKADKKAFEELQQDRRRTVVIPSQADLDTARAVYATVSDEFAAKSSRHAVLVRRVHEYIAKFRVAK